MNFGPRLCIKAAGSVYTVFILQNRGLLWNFSQARFKKT